METNFVPIKVKYPSIKYFKEGFDDIIMYYNLSKIKGYKKEGMDGIWSTFICILKGQPLRYKMEEKNGKEY